MPVGADEFVMMDAKNPYVGELESAHPAGGCNAARHQPSRARAARRQGIHGARGDAGQPRRQGGRQSRLGPQSGRSPDRKPPHADRPYAKSPLQFTAKSDTTEGRFEVAATGSGTLHIGAVSLMPADNVSGFKADSIRC